MAAAGQHGATRGRRRAADRSGSAEAGRYPHPDSHKVFLRRRVVRLEPFADTDEVSARALFAPNDARKLPWVRDHLSFYEEALARARRRTSGS